MISSILMKENMSYADRIKKRITEQGETVLTTFEPEELIVLTERDQPIQTITTNLATSKNNSNNSKRAKHLTTFKGNNSNNNTNKRSFGKKPSIINLEDRNSLESIRSKFSNSSVNDESQHQQYTNQSAPTNFGNPTDVQRYQQSAALTGSQTLVATRYVSPPIIANNNYWTKSDELMNSVSLEDRTCQLVAMVSLTRNDEPDLTSVQNDRKDDIGPSRSDGCGGGGGARSSRVSILVPDKNGPPFLFAGIAASIAGSVFFSFSILCIKLLPDSDGFHDKAKALFFRGIFMMSFCAIAIICRKSTFVVHRDELCVNILRALFGTLSVLGSYCSLNYIGMGDAMALIFSSPIWTSILSYFILKEPLNWFQLLALPASIFGIVLIAHPALIVTVDQFYLSTPSTNFKPHLLNTTSATNITLGSNITINEIDALSATTTNFSFDYEQRWIGILIALLTSLLISCTYIVLKFRKTTPIQTTTFWLGVAVFLTSAIIIFSIGFGEIPSTLYEWFLLFGNGICSWVGQSLLQWAFLHEEAGLLSIVRTLDVAMTFILSALFLDDDIYWTSIVGATIIILVVISMMLNNWILKLTCMSEKKDDRNGIKKASSKEIIESTPYTISKA